ncbi:MAG: DUF6746 family protein [Verrucomicrobiia bacterium]
MKTAFVLVVVAILALYPANAEERPAHFSGKEAPTLEDALANLKEANAELAHILRKEELEGADLLRVHMLTYTIENALEKIGEEQVRLAELMEKVHVAAEMNDAQTVKTQGATFLKESAPLIR